MVENEVESSELTLSVTAMRAAAARTAAVLRA